MSLLLLADGVDLTGERRAIDAARRQGAVGTGRGGKRCREVDLLRDNDVDGGARVHLDNRVDLAGARPCRTWRVRSWPAPRRCRRRWSGSASGRAWRREPRGDTEYVTFCAAKPWAMPPASPASSALPSKAPCLVTRRPRMPTFPSLPCTAPKISTSMISPRTEMQESRIALM